MALKKLDLSPGQGKRKVDPLQIFRKLTLRGSIQNIWEPQAEALREWQNNHRESSDVVVQMNTGGGKTLVGLLMTQSLVNEHNGHVLYVCPNNQLVEQINERAREIGLTPALRYSGKWENKEAYDSGQTFCITNYDAVFNGKSIFQRGDVDALLFDDAHVAENVIRGQFTLRINNDNAAFSKLLTLCRKHFANSGQASRFEDVASCQKTTVLFVPMYVVWQHAAEFRKTLLECGVDDDPETLFAWEHLKDHLEVCCMVADGGGLELTPVVPPTSFLSCFNPNVRRIYLTATMPSQASFARTFGIASPATIQPSGKSGDAQRLFVFVSGKDDDEQREQTLKLVGNRKCCVISPSKKNAGQWLPRATIYNKHGGQDEINRFAASDADDAKMLGLVARYDGIDLPGEACRILLLDRLPTGETLIDRFIDESVQVETIRTSHTATRVVQAIGRIFRSNTDHGVVVIVGPSLQSWLRTPKNRAYLPKLLQQQILLGDEFAKKVKSKEVEWSDLIDGVLDGDEVWDEMYNENIDKSEAEIMSLGTDWHIDLIVQEREAYELLWQGQYQAAATKYAAITTDAAEHDVRLSAWHLHWQALAMMSAGDRQGALCEFNAAANIRSELGRPSEIRETVFKVAKAKNGGSQAKKLAAWYGAKRPRISKALDLVDRDLIYGPETNKAEEALRVLGDLLGLNSVRPDKTNGKGPDVAWTTVGVSNAITWGFELKTDKTGDSYSKEDIGQCHNHEEELAKECGELWELAIVGPMLNISPKASPSAKLCMIEAEAFLELRERARKMIESVDAGDKASLEQEFQKWLNFYGLNWPQCVESLSSRLVLDMKTGN